MATLPIKKTINSRHTIIKSILFSCSISFLAACQTQEAVPVDSRETTNPQPPSIAQPAPQKTRIKNNPRAADEVATADASLQEHSDLWHRIRDGFQLQAEYSHPGVQELINQHSDNQRLFDLVALRASPFLFAIVEEIEGRGLPLELALLPIVESTYNPNAYSPNHAVGLWQMISPTATSYGVQQDWWFDGRRDPLISTSAALDYLETLYGNFGNNWLVAIGAYNTGGGNMRRAMRRGDQSYEDLDFWSLPVALETQSLVPKLLAFAAIVNDIDNHGIELPAIANKPGLEAIELPGQIDLAQAAGLLGIDYDDLRNLNPGYLQWATHPDGPHVLMVPPAKAQGFRQKIATLDPAKLLTWDRYQIKSGDTLSGIASKLGTRADVLMYINDLNSSRIIVGDSLLIPRSIDSIGDLASYNSVNLPAAQATPQAPTRYTVRSGDNLWSIARKFDLRSAEIAKWNDFAINATLRPGQILDLSLAQDDLDLVAEEPKVAKLDTGYYQVNRGDTINRIARRFARSASDLLKWNGLSKTELIYPGQEIRVTPPDTGVY
jgi:membrane-bound lytic murein transglycosylase D